MYSFMYMMLHEKTSVSLTFTFFFGGIVLLSWYTDKRSPPLLVKWVAVESKTGRGVAHLLHVEFTHTSQPLNTFQTLFSHAVAY